MLAFVVALALLSTGCSLILPTSDDLAGGEGGSSAGCPGTQGPAMVNVGTHCIDSTEVTAEQYSAFLDAAVPVGENPDPGCASGNSSYQPTTWPNGSIDDRPVVYVDWCDAIGFCSYAGKHLCGAIGGEGLDSENYPLPDPNPEVDEWFHVCANGELDGFPYGPEYVAGACNREATAELTSVKAFAGCHGLGDNADVFDLGGNASEWVDVCTPGFCRVNGGAIGVSTDECSAGASSIVGKDTTHFNVGFRCCANVAP